MFAGRTGLAICVVLASAAACGDSEKQCTSDKICGSGFRCEEVTLGDPKVCVACDAEETRYDGVDNDCNIRTLDDDLDGDGDNWKGAPVSPGGDCDDNDSLVSSKLSEICNDTKDNDCDGVQDEPDCGDRAPPDVSILSPMPGAFVSAAIVFQIEAEDDVGVRTIRLISRGLNGEVELASQTFASETRVTASFPLDTTQLPDGPATFIFEASDIADKVSRATIELNLDNMSAPIILIARPGENVAYGGRMTVLATASDSIAVASVEVRVDDILVMTATSPTNNVSIAYVVDTTVLADGPHAVHISATDALGYSGTVDRAFIVDNAPPAVSITSPGPNTTVSGTVMVDVSATDNRTVAGLKLFDETIVANTTPAMHTFSFDSAQFPNGTLMVVAEASDGAIIDDVDSGGNASSYPLRIVVDNPQPEPKISLSLADGSEVLGITEIDAQVTSDIGADILRVNVSVDGLMIATYEPSEGPIPRYYDFSDRPGPHVIHVDAFDDRGNQGGRAFTVYATRAPRFGDARELRTFWHSLDLESLGDLNGDGILDGVVSGGFGTIVYLGMIGPSGWELGLAYRVSRKEGDALIADLDGDGASDVLIMSSDEYTTLISGAQPEVVSANPTQGDGRTLVDTDQDGDLDIVEFSGRQFDLLIYENDMGMFTPGAMVGSGDPIGRGAVFRDLDGDLDLDAVLCGNPTRTYFLDAGAYGNLVEIDPGEPFVGRSDCRLADVNGDGTLDVITMSYDPVLNGTYVTSMAGIPASPGMFAQAATSTTPASAFSFDLIDLNQDALLDVILAGGGPIVARTAINRGDGVFVDDSQIFVYAGGFGIRTIDIDDDGDLDILRSYGTSGIMGIATNDGSGSFNGPSTTNLDRLGLVTAKTSGDFAGSPLQDIAYLAGGAMIVLENLGDRLGLSSQTNFNTQSYSSITAGNIDGQGYEDIVCASRSVGGVDVYRNEGAGNFTSLGVEDRRTSDVEVADVDGDGLGDVIMTSWDAMGHGSAVWSYDVSSQSMSVIDQSSAGTFPDLIVAGDVGNDSPMTTDYVFAQQASMDLIVRKWNGSGFDTTILQAAGADVRAMVLADINGDSVEDLVRSDAAGVHVMDGVQGGTFAMPRLIPNAPVNALSAADINRDGRLDLIGNGVFAIATSQGGFFPRLQFWDANMVDDFNGDGVADLAQLDGIHAVIFYNRTP